jgi:pyruvate-formate lyase-activating enzyme
VLLPGYTDAPGDIQALSDFCREQPTLQGVELLPYHL